MEEQQRRIENGEDEEMADANSPNQSRAVARRSEAGMIGATATQRKEVRSSEIRGRQQGQRAQNRIRARDEKQNNSQKHFRVCSVRMRLLSEMLTFFIRILCYSETIGHCQVVSVMLQVESHAYLFVMLECNTQL